MTDNEIGKEAAKMDIDRKLQMWYLAKQKAAKFAEEEMRLRKEIFAHFFPKPTEGVNTAPLNGEWVIKGTHKINRTVDKALLDAKTAELTEKGIPVSQLIRNKPELETKSYKALPKEQQVIFDVVLDIKVGAPQLEITIPKR